MKKPFLAPSLRNSEFAICRYNLSRQNATSSDTRLVQFIISLSLSKSCMQGVYLKKNKISREHTVHGMSSKLTRKRSAQFSFIIIKASDKLSMFFTANTDVVFEGYGMADESCREFHFRRLDFSRLRINVGIEVESSEKTGEAEPHACVCEIATRTDSDCIM